MERVRAFLGIEALAFWMASLVHSGVLFRGHEHRAAMIAEGVIGTSLAVGLAVIAVDVRSTRVMGVAVQTIALLGTLVGIFTMVVGVGPRSLFDVAIHTLFVAVLIAGLAFAVAGAEALAVTDRRGRRR